MARIAVNNLSHCALALCLLPFPRLDCQGKPLPSDAHILSCNFTIKSQTKDGEHWCQVQCSVDGVPFYQYNDNKVMDLSNLEKEVNAPKKCADLSPKLKDTGEELRKQLLTMEHEAILTRGRHTLRVTMESQYKQGQHIDTSWKFTIDGQTDFRFNHFSPKINLWEVIHVNSTGIIENWAKNTELAQGLETLAMGDFPHCLKEFLEHWEEMPRSTSRAPDITQLPSDIHFTPTMDSNNIEYENSIFIFRADAAILLLFFVVPILVAILVKKYCTQEGDSRCCSSGSSVI